jgi:hypothetical protein
LLQLNRVLRDFSLIPLLKNGTTIPTAKKTGYLERIGQKLFVECNNSEYFGKAVEIILRFSESDKVRKVSGNEAF